MRDPGGFGETGEGRVGGTLGEGGPGAKSRARNRAQGPGAGQCAEGREEPGQVDAGGWGRAVRGRGSGVRRLRGGRAPTAGRRGGSSGGERGRRWGGGHAPEEGRRRRWPAGREMAGRHRGSAPESGLDGGALRVRSGGRGGRAGRPG